MSDDISRELTAYAPQIAAMLPPDVPLEKFQQVAMAAIRQKPELERCSRQSLFNACLAAAQDGLLPDGREGAIVPRKGSAVWQPMIAGIFKKVKTSGSVASLSANVVYDGEHFEVLLGDDERIVHRRDMSMVAKGHEIAVYAIATLKDGTKEREVMTWEQVEDVRRSSAAANSGPWVEWADQMARKTVIRRLAKRLPVLDQADEALRRTIERVDTLYDFGAKSEAPDRRETINAQVPLKVTQTTPMKAAAAATPPAQRRYERPPQRERQRGYREILDGLKIALRDATSAEEVDRIICAEEVLVAKETFKDDAQRELTSLISEALVKWTPSSPPDDDPFADPINGEEKVGAG